MARNLKADSRVLISKRKQSALIKLARQLGIDGITSRQGVGGEEVVISLSDGLDAQQVAQSFEQKFPDIVFAIRRIEKSSFQTRSAYNS